MNGDQDLIDYTYKWYGDMMANQVEKILKDDPRNEERFAQFVRRSIRREIFWRETT